MIIIVLYTPYGGFCTVKNTIHSIYPETLVGKKIDEFGDLLQILQTFNLFNLLFALQHTYNKIRTV